MKLFIFSFILIFSIYGDDRHLQEANLKKCLQERWGVDAKTTHFLCNKFQPFLESNHSHDLIDDFISKSLKLNIKFSPDKELLSLSESDGVIRASQFHLIVYETPYVRILAGCAQPGEREPYHTHEWKSLLVIFEEISYEVEYLNDSREWLELKPGVYELPPENWYACINRGTKAENCLRFEVKESSSMVTTQEDFESLIAYFYGVKDEKLLVEPYLKALNKLEALDTNDSEQLKREMLPYLEEAYRSIAQQRNWDFDIEAAAFLEFQIILGNADGTSFDIVEELMVQLYSTVFRSDSPLIKKAAMLRTFLYQYKAKQNVLTQAEKKMLLEMAQISKECLNSIK